MSKRLKVKRLSWLFSDSMQTGGKRKSKDVEVKTKGEEGQVPGRPVKVFFLDRTLKIGGAERVLRTLVESFDRRRVEPVLALIYEPGQLANGLEKLGVHVYCNLARSKVDPRLLPALVRIIRRERPDIIYTCNYPITMLYGRVAGLLAGVRTHVVALHSIGYIKRPRWRALNLRMMKPFISRLVAVSEGQKRYYCATHGIPPAKIEVIHVGIDIGRFSPDSHDRSAKAELSIPEDAYVVGILAVLRPEKNHEMFLQAAKQLLTQRRGIYFMIVGDGPERRRLEELARQLGISDYVRFTGARSDVPRMLRAFDISVLCSTNIVETFPQALLEAMAMELPVVSTNVGSVGEVVVDGVTGMLVPEKDTEALADRILRLLDQPDLAREMGRAGRRRVKELFSKEVMVKRFEDLFEQLAAPRAR